MLETEGADPRPWWWVGREGRKGEGIIGTESLGMRECSSSKGKSGGSF